MLPNFFVIGAARSGTTSLYEHLRQHPAVSMSPVKEPSYFAFVERGIPPELATADFHRQYATTTRAEYEALFEAAGGAAAVGEASTLYLIAPEVAARIHRAIPDARLVAVLRNPVERAYAGYLGLRRDGHISSRSFEERLAEEEKLEREGKLYAGLIDGGYYHRHLSRFYELFGPDQIHIRLHEDLVSDPAGVARELFAFLGVDAGFTPDVSERHGATGLIRNRGLRAAWTRSGRARELVRPLLPKRARDRAFARITRDLERPPLDPDTRARLLALYEHDVLALQDLIGRDLRGWLE